MTDEQQQTKATGGQHGDAPDEPLTMEQVKKMTPDEINRDWTRVQATLGGQR